MKRFTISGLEHMVRVISTQPALLNLSSLAPLQPIINKAIAASKKCNCNAGGVYKQNRGAFELALNNLGKGDHLVMKRVLNINEICYYVRNATGGLSLKCI